MHAWASCLQSSHYKPVIKRERGNLAEVFVQCCGRQLVCCSSAVGPSGLVVKEKASESIEKVFGLILRIFLWI